MEELFLVGPAGARYVVDHWAGDLSVTDQLVDWSASLRQALVVRMANMSDKLAMEISLTTGAVVGSFPLPAAEEVAGYAPNGVGILVREFPDPTSTSSTAPGILEILGPTGALLRTVLKTEALDSVLPGPAGSVVVGDHAGVQIVSAGGRITDLDPPSESCFPLHFLTATEVLASCSSGSSHWPLRLWKLPSSGGAAQPLTPVTAKVVDALGTPWENTTAQDLDAWQLPSGLYLQVAGACATVFIGRQEAGPYVQYVGIPGVAADASMGIVGALGNELEVDVISNGCNPPPTLLWFDPTTLSVHRLLVAAPDSIGFSEIPYPTLESNPSIG